MRSGTAALAIVGVAACVAVYALSGSQPAQGNTLYNSLHAEDMEFLTFVAKYSKSYATKEEFQMRADRFKTILAAIAEENANPENTFRLAVNKFADWTPAEHQKIRALKKRAVPYPTVLRSVGDIPASIDWRDQKKVNPVKDQGQCGSCWAFSANGAMESRYAIKSGNLISVSEQQLVDCANKTTYLSEGCNGGEMYTSFDYAKDNGMMLESDYPYTAKDGACAFD